ncbi:thioredoxin-related transmembrane protein 2 homolog [Onthophagus taurus]|uniref:thioredoxin-related transmembrane protein 2 homolog n=1 Tax=Onthophagus taurus TaxID=166361 RepID=UPI000C200F48|nr:thioredoxin-related transmembrane protein 2 homolog [Onthophagus taurus]
MSLKSDLIQVLRPYYLINIALSLSYLISKKIPVLCEYLFQAEECELDGRETEILFFLLIVITLRTRKSGRVNMISYLSASFIYTKIANLILWFYADFVMGIIYGVVFIFTALILPEPTYSGPNRVIYFRDLKSLEDELKDKNTIWLIEFYTVWSPSCIDFAPIYSELSYKFSLDNLKFGKLDVGRFPEAARKYRINDGSLSKQLPTLILFRDGEESERRPLIDAKNKVVKFNFSEETVRGAFDIKNLFDSCKVGLKSKKHLKSD